MKNKYATIGIIITTVLLAGIAIFTAFKLYESRKVAISPNAPSSKPAAAGMTCGGISGLGCPSGEQCIYSNGTTRPPFTDASGTCVSNGTTDLSCGGVTGKTCADGASCIYSNGTTRPPFADASGTCQFTGGNCRLAFTLVSPSPTVTASPVPLCNSACTNSTQCPSNLTCYIASGQTSGFCRNNSCTTASNCVCKTATPTATATSTSKATATATSTSNATATATATANPQCNNSCTNNSGCPSGLMCYITNGATSGNCRNTQCLSETDCLCPVAVVITNAPVATAEPTLPVVGTRWPTILGTGFGILVILGSLLLAL